jgi:hypothetical protein
MSTPVASAYTLYTAGEYVVLANSEAYCNVEKVTGVEECFQDSGVGTILKKEFRYSIDNTTFSEFQEISEANLLALGSFATVWFQFRYILLSGGPVTITKVRPYYTVIEQDPYDGYATPRIEDQSKVYAFPVTYRSNFLWEPYKMNRAIRLYKDLNLMVNNLFGHDTQYYRALPQGRSKDVFLMEHSLFEHDEMQCVKVVVPDNAFPDNKLNMGPFGVDFEMPFEVQVDKDYFQKIFGEGTGPQKRDVLFFPRTNRVYEVSSSYLFRDFMNEPLYFKVTLIKWLPKANAEQSDSLNELESFTVSAGKLFGEEKAAEEIKITNPQQFEKATTKEDPVRSYVASLQEIKEEKIMNYHTVISEFNYNLASLVDSSEIKISLPSTLTLVKDKTYFARLSPSSTQPDVQYFYSMVKFKYVGQDINGSTIFMYSAGSSQVENLYSPSQIFIPGSLFELYENDYDGNIDISITTCDTTNLASYYTEKIVQYKGSTSFPDTQDRAFSAWFRIKDSSFSKIKIDSSNFDMYSREFEVILNRNTLVFVGDTVEITRSSSSDFMLFGTVLEVISQNSVKIEIPQYVLDFVQSSYSSWQNYTDLQLQKSLPRVFLDSQHNDKGLKIELYGQRHFKVMMNTDEHYFSMPNNSPALNKGQWYGLFVNMSNLFKQLTFNIWRIQWDSVTNIPATTDLSLVLNRTVPMKKEDRSSQISFFLRPSAMDLTNVRLFNKVAETDKQALILNQNIVKDADLAIIIDNALPQSKLPYIGYTR